jgi:protein-disulfide isomerase
MRMRVSVIAATALAASIGIAARAADKPAPTGSGAAATVGPRTITRAELEEYVRLQLIRLETQRYETLRAGLNELITVELEKQEAEARGISPGALETQEIDAKVTEPTDDEMQTFYDANKSQLGGRPFEELKDTIKEYLKRLKIEQRRAAFVEELKKKHKTTIALRPPAFQVATAGRPAKGGGAKAPVTVVVFSDYQCPFSKQAEGVLDQVMQTYGDKVQLVFRDFPLPIHPQARAAAEAASCANAQGKFWEYHAKLFANQNALGGDKLKEYAKDVGLDTDKFEQCLAANPQSGAIDTDLKDAVKLGVNSTPSFFINGRALSGMQPFERFKEAIDDELRAKGLAS